MPLTYPASGFDVADGPNGDGTGETLDPGAFVNGQEGGLNYGGAYEETDDSPEIENGEFQTVRHTYNVDWGQAQDLVAANPRGTVRLDSSGNRYYVLSSSVKRSKGNVCPVTIVAIGLDADSPAEDCLIVPADCNLAIWFHPRYKDVLNYNLDSDGLAIDSDLLTGFEIIDRVRFAAGQGAMPQREARGEATLGLNVDNVTDPDVLGLADEMKDKLRKGEDQFFLSGIKVTYISWWSTPPPFDEGSYLQDPADSGFLPAKFWSLDGTPSGSNTLLYGKTTNPNFYAGGFSWMRQCDERPYINGWFKLCMSWVGLPIGQWDADLYDPSAV